MVSDATAHGQLSAENPRPGGEMKLRYGLNPHQAPARVFARGGTLPLQALNGAPGYVNLLDALNAWQLVRDLRRTLHLPAAASFKHVSPTGAAVAVPLSDALRQAYLVDDLDLSPLATAYARARGADRVSSFGDWIALSDQVDLETAKLIRREVSDGVIAPGFEPEALDLLSSKKGGAYVVIQVDSAYEPEGPEIRDVFGVQLQQARNRYLPDLSRLGTLVAGEGPLPDSAVRDLVLAQVTVQYVQSNSVCVAVDGQVVGVGAGQQSRIHCTRLACSKADTWRLRQHPAALGLPFRREIGRPERDNAIDGYLRDDLTAAEHERWLDAFVGRQVPARLTTPEREAWLGGQASLALASDGFIPFRDNIDRASASGVRYVIQPGGSARDQDVEDACRAYGMAMLHTGVRLFHH